MSVSESVSGRNRYRIRNRPWHTSKTDCEWDCDSNPDTDSDPEV